MRAYFAIALILLSPALGWAESASDEFKINLTSEWSRERPQGSVALFRNKRSGSVISLKQITATGVDHSAFLTRELKKVSRDRATLASQFGLDGYTILAWEHRIPREGWPAYDVIEARFNALDGSDRQVVERQFAFNGKMFFLVYIEKSPALSDRNRIEAALSAFKPKVSSRGVASIQETGGPKPCTDCAPERAPAEPSKPNLSKAPTREECLELGVKPEEIMTIEERVKQYSSVQLPDVSVPLYCAKGVAESIWSFIDEAAKLLEATFTGVNRKERYDELFGANAAMEAELLEKGAAQYTNELLRDLGKTIAAGSRRFECKKPHLQAEIACKTLFEIYSYWKAAVYGVKITRTAAGMIWGNKKSIAKAAVLGAAVHAASGPQAMKRPEPEVVQMSVGVAELIMQGKIVITPDDPAPRSANDGNPRQ